MVSTSQAGSPSATPYVRSRNLTSRGRTRTRAFSMRLTLAADHSSSWATSSMVRPACSRQACSSAARRRRLTVGLLVAGTIPPEIRPLQLARTAYVEPQYIAMYSIATYLLEGRHAGARPAARYAGLAAGRAAARGPRRCFHRAGRGLPQHRGGPLHLAGRGPVAGVHRVPGRADRGHGPGPGHGRDGVR